MKEQGVEDTQETGRWLNNRAENSHLPFRRRERAMLRFRRMRSLQKSASVHASVTNHFDQERSLSSRPLFKANRTAALAEWRGLSAAYGTAHLPWPRLVRVCLPARFSAVIPGWERALSGLVGSAKSAGVVQAPGNHASP
jgi:hypothetical protein